MKLDCHVHSNLSTDSPLKPERILAMAKKRGLQGVAIANHNESLPPEVLDLFAGSGVYLIPAAEYSTDQGHVLALFWTQRPETFGVERQDGVYPHEGIIDAVRAQGGLAILAHPYGGRLDPADKVLRQFDGVEAANSRVSYRRKGAANVLSRAAAEHAQYYTAGSDAHLAFEIGRSYVDLPIQPPYSKEQIIHALGGKPPVVSRPTHPCVLSISQFYKGVRTRKLRLAVKNCATFVARIPLVIPGLFGIKPYKRKDEPHVSL